MKQRIFDEITFAIFIASGFYFLTNLLMMLYPPLVEIIARHLGYISMDGKQNG